MGFLRVGWTSLLAAGLLLFVGAGCGTQEKADPCHGIVCTDHGKCALLSGIAICVCDQGYLANSLECVEDKSVDVCAGITCSNHGTCAIQAGEPLCICEIGYHAEDLACLDNDQEDPCAGVDCSEHGTCALHDNNPICACDPGYFPVGLACFEDLVQDPCTGITCSGHGSCQLEAEQPSCVCEEGYHPEGLECRENHVQNPCDGVTCSGFGSCVVDDQQPGCLCIDGYHAEGLSCVPDAADACQEVTCGGHGSCQLQDGNPACICDPGYHPIGLTCVLDQTAQDGPVWFVHASDTHFGESATAATLTSILADEIISVIQPAATFLTGDNTDGGATWSWLSYRNSIGDELPAYPHYFEVPGNHDVKNDNTPNFEQYSQAGQAGAGLYGESLIDSPAGTIRALRANTADSPTNIINIAGFFGAAQASELLALPVPSDIAYSVIVAHHPISGLEKLRLGGDSMQQLIDHSGAMIYFSGHVHYPALNWVNTTLNVTADSVGKSDPTSYVLVSLDATGPAAKFIPLTQNPTWPQAMITQPANTDLAKDNPFAAAFTAGQANVLVRTIAFSPSTVSSVEVQVDSAAWLPMDFMGDHVWQLAITAPANPGNRTIQIRATSPEGTATDEIGITVSP